MWHKAEILGQRSVAYLQLIMMLAKLCIVSMLIVLILLQKSSNYISVNACYMGKPSSIPDTAITEEDKRALARAQWFATFGSGYAVEHGTRPSTIGNALSTSPVALLSWYVLHTTSIHRLTKCRIGEKFLDWAGETIPLETILESVTLYWFTETFPRSIYHYREVCRFYLNLLSYPYSP